MDITSDEIEKFKQENIFRILNSKEELKDWLYLYFDTDFPMGVVYPGSTHAPLDAAWDIYDLIKTGKNEDVPEVVLHSSRDSGKTSVVSAIEVLIMVHFRISCAHMAAIESQSLKAVSYIEKHFRKIEKYLYHYGWKKTSTSKRRMDWVLPDGENIYMTVIIATLAGANCINPDAMITMSDRTKKMAKDIVIGDKLLTFDYWENKYKVVTVGNVTWTEKFSRKLDYGDRSLVVSDDQQVFSRNGWMCSDQLQIGCKGLGFGEGILDNSVGISTAYVANSGIVRCVDTGKIKQYSGKLKGFCWENRGNKKLQKEFYSKIQERLNLTLKNSEYVGKKKLIDIHIDTKNEHEKSFFANGILVHNSEHVPLFCCVEGKTKIKTKNTSEITGPKRNRVNRTARGIYRTFNSGKKVELLTYNHSNGLLEFEEVEKANKTKKKLFTVEFINQKNNIKTNLGLSDDHPVFIINKGYDKLKNLSVGDSAVFLDNYGTPYQSEINEKHQTSYSITSKESELDDVDQIIMGGLLGDMFSFKRKHKKHNYNAMVGCNHGLSQKEYMEWKKSKIEKKYKCNYSNVKSGYTGKSICGFYTQNHEDLNKWSNFRKDFCGLEKLNPLGLAVWFMDDGDNGNGLRIHTEGFSEEINLKLKNVLKDNFNIEVEVRECSQKKSDGSAKSYKYLCGGVREKYKLYKICEKHIHPTMLYKFDKLIKKTIGKCECCGKEFLKKDTNNFSNFCNDIVCQSVKKGTLIPVKIEKITNENKEVWMYDFTVKNNHNFFANGVLTHNCDEIDLISDPQILEEAKAIPSAWKNFQPLTVYLSTLKFKGGLMEKVLDRVRSTGGRIYKWNMVDITEAITPEMAKVHLPKVPRYVTKELPMSNISPEEFEKLSDTEKTRYEYFEAYAGIANHELLPVMRNYLVDRPQDNKHGFYKKLSQLRNNFRKFDTEMADAQILCNKPSSHNLVIPRFCPIKNVLTIKQFYEKYELEYQDHELEYDHFCNRLKAMNPKFIGGSDWGYTDYTSLVTLAQMTGGDTILVDSFLEDMLELCDIVNQVGIMQSTWDIDRWYMENANPAYIQTLKRELKHLGIRIPEFTKKVNESITAIRARVSNSMGDRKFFILDVPRNKHVISAFGEYRWKLDAKGEIVEGQIYHDRLGVSDTMDSIRYPMQNLFNKSGKPIITQAEEKKHTHISATSTEQEVKEYNAKLVYGENYRPVVQDSEKKLRKKVLWT